MSEAQFETMRLYLILATLLYRLFLMPKYLQVPNQDFLFGSDLREKIERKHNNQNMIALKIQRKDEISDEVWKEKGRTDVMIKEIKACKKIISIPCYTYGK